MEKKKIMKKKNVTKAVLFVYERKQASILLVNKKTMKWNGEKDEKEEDETEEKICKAFKRRKKKPMTRHPLI